MSAAMCTLTKQVMKMRNKLITQFEERIFPKKRQHPQFRPGDTVRVDYKVEESAKTADGEKKFRIQSFEGVCLRYKKGTVDSTFTVRKIGANSVGVERIFPICSPYIDSITVLSGGRVRRARLYYLRELSGKAARIKSRLLPPKYLSKTVELNADGSVVEVKKVKKDKSAKKKEKAAKPKAKKK